MRSPSLFWKLFLSHAVLIAMAVGACAIIVAGWQEEQLIGQVQRRLHDSAALLGDDLAGEFGSDFSQDHRTALQLRVVRLSEMTGTRYTVVDAEGVVLADSEQPTLAAVDTMDNHLGRPEFVRAKSQATGVARRLSPTLQVPFLYCAVTLRDEDQLAGYVRASQPISFILAEVKVIRSFIWLVGLLVGLLGLAIAYWVTLRTTQPIQALTTAAEALAAGELPRRIGNFGDDELGTLANVFSEMIEKLSQRENELRASTQRHATVLSGMAEGVIAVDARERILFANEAAGRVLDFQPDEVGNQTLLEVVRDHRLRQAIQQVLSTKGPSRLELQWRGSKELEIHATPLPGEPCPGVVVVIDDVTAMRKLEGLRQQFVSNVSHELKTPLSSIKAFTETLLNGAIKDKDNRVRFLERIDEQADRLNQLIQDMLSLARIESGRDLLDVQSIALRPLIAQCLADHESLAESKPVTLINEAIDTPLQVEADEESLRQVLSNLVDNALKYTPPEGRVSVSVEQVGAEVVIEVADTGIGIAPEYHDRLFERFYRVDKARSRELGGTGLGLSIVKHLCQAMNGAVTVSSEVGKGTQFRVKLPAAVLSC